MRTKPLSLEFAFAKLMEMWPLLPRNYREIYSTYRSKHFNADVGIGVGKKIEMLQQAGFSNIWYYNPEFTEKGSNIL